MQKKNKQKKSLTPLLITIMVVIAPSLFVLGLVMGNSLPGTGSMATDSLSSWLSAIATVAIAGLTFILAKETWYLREAQTEQLAELKRENIRPNVGVQLESSPVGMNFVNVKVGNLGKGIARKVLFTFLDRNGHPVADGADVVVEKFRKLAMFRNGVHSLGIGQSISSFVFSFIDLGSELGGEIFKPFLNVDVTFEDVEGNTYVNSFAIDFAQYEGLSELGGNSLYQIASEMKKLREHVGRVANQSDGRMSINVFSSADREDEAKQTREWIDKHKKNVAGD